MKVVAFNGSPRREGNTATLLHTVLARLEEEGISTEFVQVGGKPVHGCTACTRCFDTGDNRCIIDTDLVNECIERMVAANGILLGSPTYFADLTPEMKALIDRAGFVAMANNHLFRRKVGAAVVAVRRAGSIHVFDSINHFFLISQMIVPGSSYWNIGMGLTEGEVAGDEEGMRTMEVLGENMAWLIKKVHGEELSGVRAERTEAGNPHLHPSP